MSEPQEPRPDAADEMHILRAELFALKRQIERTCGPDDLLAGMMGEALRSQDLDHMRIAKAAYESLPVEAKRRVLGGWDPGRHVPSREQLRAAMLQKPVRRFLQVDAWEQPDSEHHHPDVEGHVVAAGIAYDLRVTGHPVRVQIHEGASREVVLTLLEKVRQKLEHDWDRLIHTHAPDCCPRPAAAHHGHVHRNSHEVGSRGHR